MKPKTKTKSPKPAWISPRAPRLTLPITLSASAFFRLIRQGLVADGRAGGLLLGRDTEHGGITVVRQRGDNFVVTREQAAAGDFVLNPYASTINRPPGVEKSSRLGHHEVQMITNCEPRPYHFVHLIITNASPDDKLLWLTFDQVILKCQYTERHLNELAVLNDQKNPFLFCDLEEAFEPRDL